MFLGIIHTNMMAAFLKFTGYMLPYSVSFLHLLNFYFIVINFSLEGSSKEAMENQY